MAFRVFFRNGAGQDQAKKKKKKKKKKNCTRVKMGLIILGISPLLHGMAVKLFALL
jgi:hypothetical protein